jgi:hypothetical protein
MKKEEFKQLWESDSNGGGITFDDIAKCAKDWGLYQKPKICPISEVLYAVLKESNVNDAEDYKPQ